MQKDITLSDIMEEIRELRKDVERLEGMIRYLIESTLTLEEEESSRGVEDIKARDLSKYLPFRNLDDALKRDRS